MDAFNLFGMMALNVIWQMAAGERYDYKDDKINTLINLMLDFNTFAVNVMSGPASSFPILG